jgi:excisionase family DNA binding protein
MNILNTVNDTCSMLSMGRTALYAAVRTGSIRAVKLGKRTMFHRDEIERFVKSLANSK